MDLEQAQGLFGAFGRRLLYVIVSLETDEAHTTAWHLRADGAAFEKLPLNE